MVIISVEERSHLIEEIKLKAFTADTSSDPKPIKSITKISIAQIQSKNRIVK